MDEQNGRLTKYNPIPPERKQTIIADAMARIADETLDQIAESYGITQPTLWKWLSVTEGYDQLRQSLVDDELAKASYALQECEREIVVSRDQLSLARARALTDLRDRLLRKAQWYAERRDRRYAAKQEVQVTTVDLTQALAEAHARLNGIGITIEQVGGGGL